jgi:hypothetical protein
MTTKNFALTTSMMMLIAIAGLASAQAAGSYTRDRPAAAGRSDQQVRHAFNASYAAMATQTVDNNKYRYRDGPKSND